MFQNVKVGDVLTRVSFDFRDSLRREKAVVSAMDNDRITCLVYFSYADSPRITWFNPLNGVSVYGKEYGWLDKVSA